ncbi:MAG: ribosome biogenesis GTPase YlqF [Erysipelotrichaceae bacterium]|nr:ribosome biogenesis GTPase YlqF [Erysipelotrichaceae bacterium]
MSENKTNINWFPGHMAKTRREMSEKIKLVDMVIEIRDARIPESSVNPVINEVCGNKRRLIILAKKDKAEDELTEKWLEKLQAEGHYALALDLLHDKVAKIIDKACCEIMADKIAKYRAKGLRNVEIRAMVVGIPNVGKSTMINQFMKRKIAKTADMPGVTRSLSWVRVSDSVVLLDTPGVLWPKFEDPQVAYRLAVVGSIKDDILPLEDVTLFALDFLQKYHFEKLQKRFYVTEKTDSHTLMHQIAENRKLLQSDESIDLKRTYLLILREIRDNDLGKITWERPDED